VQSNRRKIIDILKRTGAATAEELSVELKITSVTVRHHLDVLRSEGLVSEPIVRHRFQSGRPQHAYSLTGKAAEYFPRNYDGLAEALLGEMRARLDPREINVIFEGAARRMLVEVPCPRPDEPLNVRLQRAVDFLNSKGYVASWEQRPDGLLLQTCNCPYDALSSANPELCSLDLQLVDALMDLPLQRVCHMATGGNTCAYLIPNSAAGPASSGHHS
jgi:predicted ArsR family transcriptional regulator